MGQRGTIRRFVKRLVKRTKWRRFRKRVEKVLEPREKYTRIHASSSIAIAAAAGVRQLISSLSSGTPANILAVEGALYWNVKVPDDYLIDYHMLSRNWFYNREQCEIELRVYFCKAARDLDTTDDARYLLPDLAMTNGLNDLTTSATNAQDKPYIQPSFAPNFRRHWHIYKTKIFTIPGGTASPCIKFSTSFRGIRKRVAGGGVAVAATSSLGAIRGVTKGLLFLAVTKPVWEGTGTLPTFKNVSAGVINIAVHRIRHTSPAFPVSTVGPTTKLYLSDGLTTGVYKNLLTGDNRSTTGAVNSMIIIA